MTMLDNLERSEYQAVHVLSRLAKNHPGRQRPEKALSGLRAAKAALLRASPDTLRKFSASGLSEPRWIGLPCDTTGATTMAKAARDRAGEERRIGAYEQAERRRLGLHGGRRRYAAPNELKGKRVALPGRMLSVPSSGVVDLEEGAHPAARGNSESPDHQTLTALGFRRLPDNSDEVDEAAMKAIAAAHARPIVGDSALLRFLSGNPRAR